MRPDAGVGTLEQRFWSKVDKSDGCWLWTAAKSSGGYGQFSVGDRMQKAHRVAWELTHGPIPKGDGYHGTCVLHRCDVRACCNPSHLFLGSNAANVADKVAKGRQAHLHGEAHCRSKLTEAWVTEIRAASGTQEVIAARFGISRQQVSKIRTGHSWAHLACEQDVVR